MWTMTKRHQAETEMGGTVTRPAIVYEDGVMRAMFFSPEHADQWARDFVQTRTDEEAEAQAEEVAWGQVLSRGPLAESDAPCVTAQDSSPSEDDTYHV